MTSDPTPASAARPTPDPARELDERGRRCPLPVIALAKAVVGLDPGEVVRLLADDPAARVDVPAWCRMRSHTLLDSSDPGAGVFLVQVGTVPVGTVPAGTR